MSTTAVPIGWDKELFVGADKTLTWVVRDENDAVVPVAGWTAKFEARLSRYATGAPLLTKDAVVVGDGTAGQLRVTLASADTVAMKPGAYWYGLARTNAGAWDVKAEEQFVLRQAAVRV